jgi:hypothetical protein
VGLKCAFRRCVDTRIFCMWEEVVSIAAVFELTTDDDDELIWLLLILEVLPQCLFPVSRIS